MKKRILLSLIACFIATLLNAQEKSFTTGWENGKTYRYLINQKESAAMSENDSAGSEVSYTAEVVLNTQKSGSIINWKLTAIVPPADISDLNKDLYRALENLTMKIEIDTKGKFVSIDNWDEFKNKAQEKITALKKKYNEETDIDSIDAATIIFNSKEDYEQKNIKEIKILLNHNGVSFNGSKATTIETEYGRSGDSSFAFVLSTTFTLTQGKDKNTDSMITFSTIINKDKTIAAMKEFYVKTVGEEMANNMGEMDFSSIMNMLSVTINGTTVLSPTAIPQKVDYREVNEVAGMKTESTYSIKLLK